MLSLLGRVGRQKLYPRCTRALGLQDRVQMLLRLLHTGLQTTASWSAACCASTADMAVGNMLR